jgi:hypothetical protein
VQLPPLPPAPQQLPPPQHPQQALLPMLLPLPPPVLPLP